MTEKRIYWTKLYATYFFVFQIRKRIHCKIENNTTLTQFLNKQIFPCRWIHFLKKINWLRIFANYKSRLQLHLNVTTYSPTISHHFGGHLSYITKTIFVGMTKNSGHLSREEPRRGLSFSRKSLDRGKSLADKSYTWEGMLQAKTTEF